MSAGSSRRVSSMRRRRARACNRGDIGPEATKRQATTPISSALARCLERSAEIGRNRGEATGGVD